MCEKVKVTLMKLLIFTDSHGRLQPMLDIVSREAPDAVFHLGDMVRDGDALAAACPDPAFYQVAGNCDLFYNGGAPLEQVARLAGKTVFYLHGHTRSVKTGIGAAVAQASALGADVLLYGHTHIPFCETVDGVLVLNPGAMQNGRWAILSWTEGGEIRAELRRD